jgi:hypothetical protein
LLMCFPGLGLKVDFWTRKNPLAWSPAGFGSYFDLWLVYECRPQQSAVMECP